MYAALDWYKAATEAGLHPIVGMEAYLAEGKASETERKSYHLLLLAENLEGYRNLLRLASKASLEGFYYRPRIDLEMLQRAPRRHHRDLGLPRRAGRQQHPPRAAGEGRDVRRQACRDLRAGALLHRGPGSRHHRTASGQRGADPAGEGAGSAARRHQRRPLRRRRPTPRSRSCWSASRPTRRSPIPSG